jgi:hypothetical protein
MINSLADMPDDIYRHDEPKATDGVYIDTNVDNSIVHLSYTAAADGGYSCV